MDKLAQIRQLREQRQERRARAIMSQRAMPTPAKVKEIADRAQERAGHKIINGLNEALSGAAARVTTYSVDSKQGKTTKMAGATPQSFDKSGFMRLYQRVRRAKNDDDRVSAEAALRKAFPNVRPRSPQLAKPSPAPKKPNGLSEVEKKALAFAPPKTIKRGSRKDAPRKKPKPPKPLRSMKALKRGLNGKNSRKVKAKKKKGRR